MQANSTHFLFWDSSSISVIGSLATSSLLRLRGSKHVTVEMKRSSLVQPPIIRNTSDRKCRTRGLVRSETTCKHVIRTCTKPQKKAFSHKIAKKNNNVPEFDKITLMSDMTTHFWSSLHTDLPAGEVIGADLLQQRKSLTAAANQFIGLHFFYKVCRLQQWQSHMRKQPCQ